MTLPALPHTPGRPRPTRPGRSAVLAIALLSACGLAAAQANAPSGGTPVPPLPAAQAAAKPDPARNRTTSIPAKGLFVGDKLSDSAKARLTDLIIDALGLHVEVALVVPTGPWRIEDGTHDERSLTPARLAAVKDFLRQRGIDPKRVFVESRVDAKISEPRLDVQLVGRPATD